MRKLKSIHSKIGRKAGKVISFVWQFGWNERCKEENVMAS